MAIRIEWDEFEIALLIEACEEVLRKGKPKSEVVKTVSSNLRKRAISKNIAIDDVFRNENGIALQMQKMAYLLTHGEKGMPGASKLYAEVAELREENPKKFEEILKRAKEEIEMTDLSQQNIDKKALFAQWLNEHPIKKYTPSAIIDAKDVKCPICGTVNRSLDLDETDGWMECESCHNAIQILKYAKSRRVPVFQMADCNLLVPLNKKR